MFISEEKVKSEKLEWTLRIPKVEDAASLSRLRVQIDSETHNLDREDGEDNLSESDFVGIIKSDTDNPKDIFLVSEVNGRIVGFARCISNKLNRFSHQSEFGICILQEFCGFGIGKVLLRRVIELSEQAGVEKILLSVIETNLGAIKLYESLGFIQEGVLLNDRKIEGKYYNTILMGRFKNHKNC